jgi:hypothetical protein
MLTATSTSFSVLASSFPRYDTKRFLDKLLICSISTTEVYFRQLLSEAMMWVGRFSCVSRGCSRGMVKLYL